MYRFQFSWSWFQTASRTGLPIVMPPDARQDVHPVLLDGHPAAPAVAVLAAGQVGVDHAAVHLQPGGKAVQEGEDTPSMGFTSGVEDEHETPRTVVDGV